MMHITDINHDIARGDIRGIEEAFRALIAWPKEEEIRGATPITLKRALKAACEALEGDPSIMPRAVLEPISEAAGEAVGATYGEGATAVLDRLTYWLTRFEIEMAA
ncbi:hypothetical protein HF259_06295 [Rhizobium leguminosarum]|uniref:hypothetical protein n=1 Tax=Rhizobium leguminosarum TaxID=384 RepID=UPI001C91124A|nr:hypothetical protein [Rhizobium leguminosarum]MBY2921049.1 hypothetical protein [Rhizobium leguminosarum]